MLIASLQISYGTGFANQRSAVQCRAVARLGKWRGDQVDLSGFQGPTVLQHSSCPLQKDPRRGLSLRAPMAMGQPLDTVFVYGTLLAEEVTKLVLDRVPVAETGA